MKSTKTFQMVYRLLGFEFLLFLLLKLKLNRAVTVGAAVPVHVHAFLVECERYIADSNDCRYTL